MRSSPVSSWSTGIPSMRLANPGIRAVAFLLVAPLFVVFAGSIPPTARSAQAEARAPKEPDPKPRFQPKTAELTASVEPSEAKPGDTVTFKVTAKLQPTYHIYTYSKKP